MKWDIPERVEDALVAYLSQQATGDMRVYAAWGFGDPQYPAAVVGVLGTEPVSEEAEWHDPQLMSVSVAIITEAAPILNGDGSIRVTARERNAAARSGVIEALATTDLLANLQNMGTEGVAFSMAQMAGSERSSEDHKLVTTLTVGVIAEPVTES